MKNLIMMITVALMVLGVVYIVKHRKQPEPVHAPAFNSGATLESQPPGEFDGEYSLAAFKCNERNAKEQKVSEAQKLDIKIRGMSGKITKKAAICEASQYITLVPNQTDLKNPALKSIQLKQNRLECSAECKCYPLLIGSTIGIFNNAKKEIRIVENVRSDKSMCGGKLPVILKYTASANSPDKK